MLSVCLIFRAVVEIIAGYVAGICLARPLLIGFSLTKHVQKMSCLYLKNVLEVRVRNQPSFASPYRSGTVGCLFSTARYKENIKNEEANDS